MHRVLLFSLLCFSCLGSWAQQHYFVMINHHDKLPFYVRMGESIYSSSPVGHLILAPLADSTYIMYIGFPRSRSAEPAFEVKTGQRDRGFMLIKGGVGWQLTDLLTGDTLEPISNPGTASGEVLVKRTDSFSQLMADVVDDSSVLYTAVSKVASKADSSGNQPKTLVKKSDTVRVAALDRSQAGLEVAEKKRDSLKVELKKADTLRILEATAARKENGAVDSARQDSLVKTLKNVSQRDALQTDSIKKYRPEKEMLKADAAGSLKTEGLKTDSGAIKPLAPTLKTGTILKLGSEIVEEGRLFIYVDLSGSVADTIRLIIPRL